MENMAKPDKNNQEFGTVTGNSTKLLICVIHNDVIWSSFVLFCTHLENTVLFSLHIKNCIVWSVDVCVCVFKRAVNSGRKCVCCGSVEIFLFLSDSRNKKTLTQVQCGQCWAPKSELRFYIRVYHSDYLVGYQSLSIRVFSLVYIKVYLRFYLSLFTTYFTTFNLKLYLTFTSDFCLIFYLSLPRILLHLISK